MPQTMIDAYIECALWSSNDDARDPEGHGLALEDNYGRDDLAPETLDAMRADCEAFAQANAEDLATYYNLCGYDEAQAGHDFWLTRNRHGTGFWDRANSGAALALQGALDRLTEASHAYGECNIYAGDDGQLYIA